MISRSKSYQLKLFKIIKNSHIFILQACTFVVPELHLGNKLQRNVYECSWSVWFQKFDTFKVEVKLATNSGIQW